MSEAQNMIHSIISQKTLTIPQIYKNTQTISWTTMYIDL